MSRCEECVRCTECEGTAYCLSQPGTRPCPHDLVLCENDLDACPDCRRDMQLEMYESGVYNALSDPFINTHAQASDAAYVDRLPIEINPGTFRYPEESA